MPHYKSLAHILSNGGNWGVRVKVLRRMCGENRKLKSGSEANFLSKSI